MSISMNAGTGPEMAMQMNLDWFISQRLPAQSLAEWQASGPAHLQRLSLTETQQQVLCGIEPQRCHLSGYISNEAELREQLQTHGADSLQDLLNAAVLHWGHEVNRHLLGDYVLVWLDQQQLLVSSAARAGFTLFYLRHNGLSLAATLPGLSGQGNSSLNEAQLLRNLQLGPLADGQSGFNHINQLQPGETLVWQLGHEVKLLQQIRLPLDQQWSLAQQVVIPQALPVAPSALSGASATAPAPQSLDRNHLFQALPQLAHRLGEPLPDAALAEFDSVLANTQADVLLLHPSWLAGRNVIDAQAFEHNQQWCKSILGRRLLEQCQALKDQHHRLSDEFRHFLNAQQDPSAKPLTFERWLDLHYVLPAWCRLLQRIAQCHGKTLINPYLSPEQALTLPKPQAGADQSGYFSLLEISICNVYDAMQRLFHYGETLTLDLFTLTPPATARLVGKRQEQPRRVEQVCIQLLTLDYLARFYSCRLD